AATSPAPRSRLTAASHRVCFERRSASRSRRHVGRAEELQSSIVAHPSHRLRRVGPEHARLQGVIQETLRPAGLERSVSRPWPLTPVYKLSFQIREFWRYPKRSALRMYD